MMNCKKSIGEYTFDVFNVTFISIFLLLCLYPFIYIFNTSISSATSAAAYGLHILPKGPTFKYYLQVFKSDAIFIGIGNSVFRTVFGTSLMLLFTVMGAYPLSKKHFPNRRFWTTLVVITMFFDGGLIPNYFLVKSLHLTETRWAMILPGLVNTFYVLVMRNFMMTIPENLEESAKIDGANEIVILSRIILPVCKPVIATVALWAAVWHWNAWFDCLIYTTKSSLTVLQLVLYHVVNAGSDQIVTGSLLKDVPYPETIKSCTIMITILPIVMVYPFVQKYFIKGILLGSIKG